MKVFAFIVPSHLRAKAIELREQDAYSFFNPDDYGWGNGYIAVSKEHPWFGVEYNELPMIDEVEELTFSGLSNPHKWEDMEFVGEASEDQDYWVIGFDTAHSWNNIHRNPKEDVIRMTNLLLDAAQTQ